jgi:hypothetical protein
VSNIIQIRDAVVPKGFGSSRSAIMNPKETKQMMALSKSDAKKTASLEPGFGGDELVLIVGISSRAGWPLKVG